MPSSKLKFLRLYLICHGETEWSLSGQYTGLTGLTDLPLTAHGEAAAREVGKRLQNIPFAHVRMSPLQRARQTCALAALKSTPEIEPDNYERQHRKKIFRGQPGEKMDLSSRQSPVKPLCESKKPLCRCQVPSPVGGLERAAFRGRAFDYRRSCPPGAKVGVVTPRRSRCFHFNLISRRSGATAFQTSRWQVADSEKTASKEQSNHHAQQSHNTKGVQT